MAYLGKMCLDLSLKDLKCFGASLEESVADSDNCQGFYHGG